MILAAGCGRVGYGFGRVDSGAQDADAKDGDADVAEDGGAQDGDAPGDGDADGDAPDGDANGDAEDGDANGGAEDGGAEDGGACEPGTACDRFVAIAAGAWHSCAARESGQVVCWGINNNGELGLGDRTTRLTAEVVPGIHATALAAGAAHTCAILEGGTLACWGGGGNGQLGDGTWTTRENPTVVPGLSDSDVVAVAATRTTCAAGAGGAEVWCWGEGSSGQLGSGTTESSPSPVRVMGLAGTTTTALAAGSWHVCALGTDRHVRCWGDDSAYGQLGDAARGTGPELPVEVAGLDDAVEISAGSFHTCARRAAGAVVCWGYNGGGQLGNGTAVDAETPVEVQASGGGALVAAHVAAGDQRTCAILDDARVECWGGGGGLEHNDVSRTNRVLPEPVSGLDVRAELLALGFEHTCAVTPENDIACWGLNPHGEFGTGVRRARGAPEPVSAATGLIDVTQISLGPYNICALDAGYQVWCWGKNAGYGAGQADPASVLAPTRLEAASMLDAREISVGGAHSCVRTALGAVWCWGYNASGQLGNGVVGGATPAPVEVVGLSSAVGITAGGSHTCAVDSLRAVFCWGGNDWGQLDGLDGDLSPTGTPRAVAGLDGEAALVAAGKAWSFFTCALLLTDLGVTCWGHNGNSQLGTPGRDDATIYPPTRIAGFAAKSLGVGFQYACAIAESDSSLWCWGRNGEGQLGVPGAWGAPAVRVDLPALLQWVSLGDDHTCAVTTGNDLYCWGPGTYGELGDGAFTSADEPVFVASGIESVSAGGDTTCAIDTDGDVLCWGNCTQGRCGDGVSDVLTVLTPVVLP